jgi:hypothetical protein
MLFVVSSELICTRTDSYPPFFYAFFTRIRVPHLIESLLRFSLK